METKRYKHSVTLTNVLHVPVLVCLLPSVSALHMKNFFTTSFRHKRVVSFGSEEIVIGYLSNVLYVVQTLHTNMPAEEKAFQTLTRSHVRLAQVHHKGIRRMMEIRAVSEIDLDVEPNHLNSDLVCHSCSKRKGHRLPSPSVSNNKSKVAMDLVHSFAD